VQIQITLNPQPGGGCSADCVIDGKPCPPVSGDDPAMCWVQVESRVAAAVGASWDPDNDQPDPAAGSQDQGSEQAPAGEMGIAHGAPQPGPNEHGAIPTLDEMWQQEAAGRMRKRTAVMDMS